ncbi:MAG: fused MFS/spermidine synthase [Gemmataceae bacterium]|nr:fused MFS/spermidine synthase [Gemmataceae bacterium]MCS7270709.1 fused MFS/spermidine synthase [Gemmataceae bacterium]MDW8243330.1 fused MFS/spermidine synthase [Thermogemmata sp.]
MLPALYAAALFVGAATLFLVQPLIGKLLLPLLGGPPGVWNTCMVFFQFVLLLGYLYAHHSFRRLGVHRQIVLHSGLLLAVMAFFGAAVLLTGQPMPIAASLLPEDQDYPIGPLVLLLAMAVGAPFFLLSTSSPVLQRWYAASGHRTARDPYFLYAASNAGSLVGLLGYPLLLEPALTLEQQQWVFLGGTAVYMVLAAACAVAVIRGGREAAVATDNPLPEAVPSLNRSASALPLARVARWVFLAALPSCLLLGVTTHVSTDLAPVPLLWAVPLALYLVSFILVFSRWPLALHRFFGRITPALILFVVLTLLLHAAEPFWLVVLLHLGALLGVCLICHGELALDRPPAEHLTAYYLWMSLGGMLGGVVVALLAPVLFHKLGMLEYPLALLAAAMVRPRCMTNGCVAFLEKTDLVYVLVLLGAAVALVIGVSAWWQLPAEADPGWYTTCRWLRGGLIFGLPAVGAFALARRPLRYALALAALFVAGTFDRGELGRTLHMERNFFGVVRVTLSPDGVFRRLVHGNTIHGQQRTDDPPERPRPMTYYHSKGPMGHLFHHLPPQRLRRVGIIGLGTGALAAYAQPGQQWTFFEIDPAVVRIAHDYFDFLAACRAERCDIVLGDARRQLQRRPDDAFDLLILDGFCSDAIPIHLLTREAFELYFQKLAPGGILAVHISNNHLDLPPLVARIAADIDPLLAVRYCYDIANDEQRADGKSDSQWMLLAEREQDLGPLARTPYWEKVPVTPGPIWRDNFANVLRVWKRQDD